MSGFRGVGGGRAHRERAQPAARVHKHGMLEKKKDYRLRARDFHRKQSQLKALRALAATRNPDEFARAMVSAARAGTGTSARIRLAQQKNGRKRSEHDAAKMLFSQGTSYVRNRLQMERKKAERLQSSLHGVSSAAAAPERKHTLFAETESAAEEVADNPAAFFDTPEQFALSTFRPRLSDAASEGYCPIVNTDAPRPSAAAKAKRKQYTELIERTKRADKLDAAASALELQQHLMRKGRRQKVREGDVETGELPVYRWKQSRKR